MGQRSGVSPEATGASLLPHSFGCVALNQFLERGLVADRVEVAVLGMTGCNEWERGLDVVVEGEAVQVIEESVLKRLAEAWETKWDGRWHYEVHEAGFRHEANADAILVFSVKSTKVLAFAKGTFGQTRHRFSQE